MKKIVLLFLIGNLTACALTPEQIAEREARRIRQEQDLQVALAEQCDSDTADLMYEQFNPPLSRSPKAQKQFEKRYVKKVNNPMFQACYNLAWKNYREQEAIRQIRDNYARELENIRDHYRWDLDKIRFHYESELNILRQSLRNK